MDSSPAPPLPEGNEPFVFVFGNFEFDEGRWELRDRGKPVEVPPKVMQTLAFLIRHRERVTSTEDLLAELWPNVTVTEASLTKAIRIARQVLGDDGDSQRCIKTTRGRGYRFVADVLGRPSTISPPPPVPSAVPTPAWGGTRVLPLEPFVGRDAELAELNGYLGRALAGRPGFLLVSGEVGIGKTRLLETFARGAVTRGARVIWGRSSEEGGAPELWPWIQILRDVLAPELETGGDGDTGKLWRLVRGTLESEDRGSSPPRTDAERFRVFDAVARAVSRASKTRVLVLILEDLHAADASTLILTRFLGKEIRDAGVLLLGTYRSNDAGRSEPFTKLLGSTPVLTLRGLSADATRLLMDASLERALSAPMLARVHQVSEGNPLFLAEIARHLATTGPPQAAGELEIPSRIVEAIRARFDALPEATRQLLGAASVIGRQFELPLLMRVSPKTVRAETDALARLLEPAILRGIIAPVQGMLLVYQFTHLLLRDVLYEALPLAERADLHRRAGEVLEAAGAPGQEPPAARLAHHFSRATLGAGSAKAVAYSSAAARRALRSFAFEDAALHFERALEALHFAAGQEAEATDLRLALAHAQRLSGDYARARQTLDRALTLTRAAGDSLRFARAALDYAQVLPESGEINQELLPLLEEAASVLGGNQSHDPDTDELRSLVGSRLATCTSFAGRRERALALSERALVIARSLGRPRALAHALHARHWLLWRPGTAHERLAIASEMIELERSGTGDLPTMEARLCEITDLLELGRGSALSQALSRYERAAQSLRDPSGLYSVRVFHTMRAILEGRFEDAERLTVEALPIGIQIHPDNATTFFGTHLWWTRVEQGRASELEVGFRERVDSLPSSAALRAGLLRLHVEAGAVAETRKELDALMQRGLADLPDDWSVLPTLAHLSAACFLLGDADVATTVEKSLLPYAAFHVVLGPAILYLGPVSFYLGLLALTRSSFGDAILRLERALLEGGSLGARPLVARAQLHLAQARERRAAAGDHARAVETAAAARVAFRDLGMTSLERQAAELHGRLTARPIQP